MVAAAVAVVDGGSGDGCWWRGDDGGWWSVAITVAVAMAVMMVAVEVEVEIENRSASPRAARSRETPSGASRRELRRAVSSEPPHLPRSSGFEKWDDCMSSTRHEMVQSRSPTCHNIWISPSQLHHVLLRVDLHIE